MNARFYLSFAIIFALGAVTGWCSRAAIVHGPAAHLPVEQEWAEKTLTEYRSALSLTDDQAARIRPEMERTAQQLREVKGSVVERLREVVRQNSTRIMEQLDDRQRHDFELLLEKKRAAMEAKQRLPHDKNPN